MFRQTSRIVMECRHLRMLFLAPAVTLILMSGMAPRLLAQSDLGTVRGSVQDQTGAAISAASVELASSDTGLTRKAVGDSTGNFSFSAVPRGNYTATVTANGFQTEVQPFVVQVSQDFNLAFKLKAGSVSESITVSDAAPIVDVSTSSTGSVIQAEQIQELPLNGRNFTQLALLVPGVTRGAYGSVFASRRTTMNSTVLTTTMDWSTQSSSCRPSRPRRSSG